MRRVGIIGNSHVGCVKTGLDLARSQGEFPDIAVDIFASTGVSLFDCQIGNGLVTPLTNKVEKTFQWSSGGKSEIRLDDYDDIFLIAGVSPYFLEAYIESDVILPTSRAVVREAVGDWAGRRTFKMADALAMESVSARVHFVGAPFQSDESPLARRIMPSLMADENLMRSRVATIKQMITDCLAQLHSRVATIYQPPSKFLEQFGVFTKDEYCKNSERLMVSGKKHPDYDYRHMNGVYGLRLIRVLFSGQNTEWASPALGFPRG